MFNIVNMGDTSKGLDLESNITETQPYSKVILNKYQANRTRQRFMPQLVLVPKDENVFLRSLFSFI